jgi:hypothetical protein
VYPLLGQGVEVLSAAAVVMNCHLVCFVKTEAIYCSQNVGSHTHYSATYQQTDNIQEINYLYKLPIQWVK